MKLRYRPLPCSFTLATLLLLAGSPAVRGAQLPMGDRELSALSDGTPFEEPENNPHLPPTKKEPEAYRPKPIPTDEELGPTADPVEGEPPSSWERVRKVLRRLFLARGF